MCVLPQTVGKLAWDGLAACQRFHTCAHTLTIWTCAPLERKEAAGLKLHKALSFNSEPQPRVHTGHTYTHTNLCSLLLLSTHVSSSLSLLSLFLPFLGQRHSFPLCLASSQARSHPPPTPLIRLFALSSSTLQIFTSRKKVQ